MAREYAINIHKRTHRVAFKKCAPWALGEIQKFAMKEMGTLDVYIQTQQSCLGQQKRNIPYCI